MLVGTQFVTNPIKNNVCINLIHTFNGRSHQTRRDIPNSYIGQPDCCQFFWKLRELRTVCNGSWKDRSHTIQQPSVHTRTFRANPMSLIMR